MRAAVVADAVMGGTSKASKRGAQKNPSIQSEQPRQHTGAQSKHWIGEGLLAGVLTVTIGRDWTPNNVRTYMGSKGNDNYRENNECQPLILNDNRKCSHDCPESRELDHRR